MNKLSVVIPTYNESKNIEVLLSKIDEALTGIDYEVIFVDDSTDDTPAVIEEITKKDARIRMKHRTTEKGLATAVLLGFSMAEGDYVACMDADLQHPPKTLREMYAAMEAGADVCIPSRFIPGGSDGGLNWYRKLVSGTARYMGKIILSSLRKVTDPTSGLFMLKKEMLQGAELKPIGWKIMVEVLAVCKFSYIIETPYCFQERNAGESKLDMKVTLEYIKQLFMLLSRQSKKKIMVEKWSQQKLDAELAKLQ